MPIRQSRLVLQQVWRAGWPTLSVGVLATALLIYGHLDIDEDSFWKVSFDKEWILIIGTTLSVVFVGLVSGMMVAIARARRRVEGELGGELRRLMSILDNIDALAYVSDPVTHEIIYLNEALKKLLGDVRGQKCYGVLQGMTEPCPFCTNDRIFGENVGKTHVWEFQNRRNGRWYRCIDKAIPWPDGRMVRYEMAIDLTDRKAIEEALRRERDFAEGIIETAQTIILVLDGAGRIVRYNPYVEKLTGYPLAEVAGREWISLFVPDADQATVREVFRTAIADVQTKGYISTIQARDGRLRKIEWYDRTLKNPDGQVTGLLAIGMDITERLRNAEVARRQQLELEQLHRLTTMGEFAAGLAHELNQPLCAISSCAQAGLRLLRSPAPDLVNIEAALAEAVAQAVRAAVVIRRMRGFIRKQEPQRLPTDLAALIRETANLVQAEAERQNIAMVVELPAYLPSVPADRVQIQQVLLNLIRNAFESIGAVSTARGRLAISAVARDNSVEVAVSDSGGGLPADGAERVFESFFTTKKAGLGLGLALSRSFIEGHGGRIWAGPNDSDGGATFRFTLPLTTGI